PDERRVPVDGDRLPLDDALRGREHRAGLPIGQAGADNAYETERDERRPDDEADERIAQQQSARVHGVTPEVLRRSRASGGVRVRSGTGSRYHATSPGTMFVRFRKRMRNDAASAVSWPMFSRPRSAINAQSRVPMPLTESRPAS